MNQYRVAAEAKSNLDGIWLYIAHDNPDVADNMSAPSFQSFRRSLPCLSWDVDAQNYRPACAALW